MTTTDIEVKKKKRTRKKADVPAHEKVAITYAEAEALGLGSERMLRGLIAAGKLQRCVMRIGRSVKLLRGVLIEELQEQGG